MTISLRSPLAAAAVIGVLVLGALFLIQRNQPPVVGHPSPTPATVPSPSLPGFVAPSPTSSAPGASGFPRSTGVWIEDRFDGHASHRP